MLGGIFLAEFSLRLFRRPMLPEYRMLALSKLHAQQIELEDAAIAAPDGAVLKAWLFLVF